MVHDHVPAYELSPISASLVRATRILNDTLRSDHFTGTNHITYSNLPKQSSAPSSLFSATKRFSPQSESVLREVYSVQ